MSKIVSLSRYRKDRARAEKRSRGDANAAKFGRSKADKHKEQALAEQARTRLDGHRRSDPEPE